MLHLLQQTVKVWPVWQAETKGPFPSLPNPLSLFPPFPSPFLRLSRRLEKYNHHFFFLTENLCLIALTAYNSTSSSLDRISPTPGIQYSLFNMET